MSVTGKKTLWTILILTAIVLLGLILRISYLRAIVDNPDFSYPQMDAGYHDYWARAMVTDNWSIPTNINSFSDPEIRNRAYFRPPGYPFFLAFTYYLFDGSYLAIRIFQMGMGLLNCVLAYLLGKTLFKRTIGLIFSAFMSVYWVFIYFEGELLAPILLVTLGLSLMLNLYHCYERLRFWQVFTVGIFLGLFALVRPNILLFSPVVFGWMWWIGKRRNYGKRIIIPLSGVVLGAVLVVAPVTIRNYLVTGDLVLITSNAGINLYIGNNEMSDGYSAGIPGLEKLVGSNRWKSSDYPKIVRAFEALEGKEMTDSEMSGYFSKKAVDYILRHPGRTLKLAAIKTLLFWGPMEVSNNKEIYYEKKNSSILRCIPGFPVVLSIGILGLIRLFLDSKVRTGKKDTEALVSRREFEIAILIAIFVVIYFVSFLPFFVAGRYRVPLIPFLLLFGAYGLYRLIALARQNRLRSVVCWAITYIVLYMLANIPIASYRASLSEWHDARAICYRLAGRFDLAAEQCRESVKLKPNSEKAHHRLADMFFELRKNQEAIKHYSKALKLKPGQAEVHYKLGILLTSSGRYDDAIDHYRQALQIEPNSADIYCGLGVALRSQGRIDEAIRHYRKALEIQPNYGD
ncbi:tetratricopeptide repeat protein [Planctomycetota bacterium]